MHVAVFICRDLSTGSGNRVILQLTLNRAFKMADKPDFQKLFERRRIVRLQGKLRIGLHIAHVFIGVFFAIIQFNSYKSIVCRFVENDLTSREVDIITTIEDLIFTVLLFLLYTVEKNISDLCRGVLRLKLQSDTTQACF